MVSLVLTLGVLIFYYLCYRIPPRNSWGQFSQLQTLRPINVPIVLECLNDISAKRYLSVLMLYLEERSVLSNYAN